MAQVAQGDQSAFAKLYDELAPLIFGIIRRILRDPAMSEEVTQEVFTEIWRIAPRFDGSRGSVRGWASTIAHRKAVDRVRSEQSRRNREDRDHQNSTEATFDPVVEAIDRADTRATVHEALETLTTNQREAVTLAYFEGNTYREVAQILEIPEGTAKTRIRDGLSKLRERIGSNQ